LREEQEEEVLKERRIGGNTGEVGNFFSMRGFLPPLDAARYRWDNGG